MRTLLLLSLVVVVVSVDGAAQAPATPARPQQGTTPARPPQGTTPAAPRPAQPTTPAPTQPAPRRAPVSTRAGMAITVTNPTGGVLSGVQVELLGATERRGETNTSGQINFPGLQAGTYRLRFSSSAVNTFEREVTLRGGQIADLDITLNLAPPPPPPPPAPVQPAEPPPPAAPVLGPPGQPRTLSVVDLIEREFVGRQPRRESLISCSGNARTTLIQLNENLPDRLYDTGEATYYVLGGEGSVKIEGRDTAVQSGAFVSIPRGTSHSFAQTGRRPLILLQSLSGAPCEQVR
jgi:hypothetical protein